MPTAGIFGGRGHITNENSEVKSVLSVLFGLFAIVAVPAQVLDNATGITILGDPDFNPSFIRANKIETITAELSIKRESDIIRLANEIVNYQFDRVGRLVQIEKIRKPGLSSAEVTATIFRYDLDGHLIDRILADTGGATSYRYGYDDEGRIISETCSRMKSPTDTLLPVGPDRTEIYTEYFSYSKVDDGVKKITYNSYRKPYKEELFLYDELGYLRENTQRYLMNNRRGKTSFSYNERGLLQYKEVINDLAVDDTTRMEYEYDDAGNLLSALEYHNGKLKRRIEFMYTADHWTLDARLTKVEETQLIRIVRYKTFFRD